MTLEQLKQLNEAHGEVTRAMHGYAQAVRKAFEVGMRVEWRHGERVRAGTVESVSAYDYREDHTLHVRSDSGKLVKVSVWSVRSHMREQAKAVTRG